MFREIVEEIGRGTLQTLSQILEFFAPIVPGNTFPLYFEIELFQSRAGYRERQHSNEA